MTGDGPTTPRSLSDDQISSRFLLTEDVVREAVGLAETLSERAAQVESPDDAVDVPSAQFQTIVESLGVMHKTLINSINARLAADSAGQSGPEESADSALVLSARLLKAQNGAALVQAKLLVDAVRRTQPGGGPDFVDVPAHAVKVITDAVLLTASLLRPVTFAPIGAAGEIVVGYSDTGDRGFMSNWYNFGNITD
jgi:hypothetical protein